MIKIVNRVRVFEVVIDSLCEVFNELGINYEVVSDFNLDHHLYLFFSFNQGEILPKKYICYNFEQLTSDVSLIEDFYKILKNAVLVLDYSQENIKYLKDNHNIDAVFLPFGYTKNMEMNSSENYSKDIDFVFLGCMNSKRTNKMKYIIDHYYNNQNKKVIGENYWGDNLKQLYNKSKITLNLHYYNPKTILEVVRINILLANKVFVISEKSNDSWYDDKYKGLITFINESNDPNHYYKEYLKVLNNYDSKEVERRYEEFKTSHKFSDYVKKIIHVIIEKMNCCS